MPGSKAWYLNKATGVIAQSSSGEVSMGTTENAVGTTSFVEAGTVVNSVPTILTSHRGTYVEEAVTIKEFLSKPYLLSSKVWATTDAIDINLFNSDIKDNLAIGIWADKLKGFGLFKGDFVLKVELNASPFQQGKLLLHYLPCFKDHVAANPLYASFKNKTFVQKLQHPHVEITCRDTSVVFKIPYIAPSEWFDLKNAYYDWGTVLIDVFSPLLTGAAAPAGQAYVDLAIYGYWENVELSAITLPQSSSSERTIKKRGGLVSESVENKGPIEEGLRRVGKVSGVLKSVPVIGEFMGPLSWATNIMGDVASALGWSKPRELDGTMVTSDLLARYIGTCDGPDLSHPGGTTVLNKLELIDTHSVTNEDELSFKYLMQIPYYCGAVAWSATAGADTSLITQKLSPSAISFLSRTTDTIGAHSVVYEQQVPFTALSTQFAMWRGGFKLILKFVKTQMHSGRLAVTWTPGTNVGTTPTITTSVYSMRTIVDIREEENVTLELPYLLSSNYLRTEDSSYSGQLDVRVLNDLRGPESVSQTVNIQWFIVPADDFELAGPGLSQRGIIPYIPQSSNVEVILGTAQQGDTIVDEVIGSKNVEGDSLYHSQKCVGERVMSLRQLLQRQTNIQGFGGYAAYGDKEMDPWFISACRMTAVTGVMTGPSIGGDVFNFVAPWFEFKRGSVKIGVFGTWMSNAVTINQIKFTSQFRPGTNMTGVQPNATSAVGVGYNASNTYTPTTSVNFMTQPAHLLLRDSVFSHLPYLGRYQTSLNLYYDGTDTPGVERSSPLAKYFYYTPGGGPVVLNRGVGEDFQFLFFTGCTPLVVSYT